MALSTLQERIERSLYHTLRNICVDEGYTPDITALGAGPYTEANQATWDTLKATIVSTKGFCIEIFSNSQTKGTKDVPRIVIVPRRTLPGDIGSPMQPYVTNNPEAPASLVKMSLPLEASHFYYDVHLITKTAQQDRVLHGILAKAFAKKRYIPYYDDPTELFFIKQTSDYDLPDPTEGIKEQVYTYELPDLFEYVEEFDEVALTKLISTELKSASPGSTLTPDGQVTGGEIIEDDGVWVNNQGISFNNF